MLDTPMLQSAYHIKSAELVIYAFILITLMRKTKFECFESSYNVSHKSFVVLTCGKSLIYCGTPVLLSDENHFTTIFRGLAHNADTFNLKFWQHFAS